MPASDFKFISPGVFVNEIDNSQVSRAPGDIGPVVIGRSEKGPGLIPTTVNSFQEFVEVFGPPTPGGLGADISRNGNSVGPTYAPYAAQAWLRNNSPVTFIRLVGRAHADAEANTGEAGWETTRLSPDYGAAGTQGGAYGLFVFQSSSAVIPTGTLAAVWYLNTGSVSLSGTAVSSSTAGGTSYSAATNQKTGQVGTNKVFRATRDKEFKVIISSGEGSVTTDIETTFNFTNSSERFIRKVFNTNPTLTNSDITPSENLERYWLGETYEDQVLLTLTTGAADQYGVIIPLANANGVYEADKRQDFADSRTGYFISQDLTEGNSTGSFDAASQVKLFRLRARNTGRWASRNLKVSIADIKAPSDTFNDYGSFSVLLRAVDDTDNRIKIIEQFNNCNLNPASENYIARKIGDKYLEWDDEIRRYKEYGDYNNRSKYVYVEMTDIISEGKGNPALLPFGVIGPPRFEAATASALSFTNTLVTGAGNFYAGGAAAGATSFDAADLSLISGALNVRFEFPRLRLRASASEGNPTDPRSVYFGVDTTFNRNGVSSKTIGDYTGAKPAGINSFTSAESATTANTEDSFVFTLDDMCNTDTTNSVVTGTNVYLSGARQARPSERSGLGYIRGTGSYQLVLDAGCDRFTTVLHGGFDGMDITEAEPFRNTYLDQTITQTELNNYAYNSLKIAIDTLRDPEAVEFDLAAMPGITNNTLNRSLIDMCEARGDAMAIVDLKGGYVPKTENTLTVQQRLGSVTETITNKKNTLQINSSFGAAYYPWVQIQDTINGAVLWAPPSIAALGAMSYGQRTQELWFAPAGFTRGGLSANNAAGIPVLSVRERLVSKDRDSLYDANINPIAQFPSEGIVIFGQKTLQSTPSALDRINVRRLLIYVKRQISRYAATLLFDQNVQSTWNRFRGQVEPFLAGVKAGLGLDAYKLVLDETTTTPDLIDRNIMYAQIFLKPTRAIEFIAIDFVITDSGASFDD